MKPLQFKQAFGWITHFCAKAFLRVYRTKMRQAIASYSIGDDWLAPAIAWLGLIAISLATAGFLLAEQ